MQRIAIPPLELRLQRRYLKMVQGHLHSVPKLAAGMSALPGVSSAFAATQGAWRFLNNEQVSLSALVEPLRKVGLERANADDSVDFALLVHDWCKLAFSHPKSDEVQLTHESDVGYELTTALLVSAANGSPLAPMEMHLKTAHGVLSTRPRTRNVSHLEQVLPTMKAALSWGLNKPLLHVIDREADSVDHLRRWEAAGHLYLIRGDSRIVKWQSASVNTAKVAQQLRQQRKFSCVGTALYQGSPAQLWVAETEVVLYRPAQKNVKGVQYSLPGPRLTLRLIVVQLRQGNGKLLAEWLLLTNAPANLITAEKLAYCYYWRWRIESLFKLLKSHGQHLESWQQMTGMAIARRLLVAAMACVIVWKLQADQSPQAQELKTILVRLSGRQTKRTTPHTAPALLAGLWVLLSMLELLKHVDLNRLKRLAKAIPYLNTG
ncbi:MAG: IS4 family transposase [Planctomycetaceae bacterium]|nr:IS4 family transposase [Planctomycetaceae bacterium]